MQRERSGRRRDSTSDTVTKDSVSTRTNYRLQSHLHGYNPVRRPVFQDESHLRTRRMSHDEKASAPRRFLIDVEETIRVVLEQEDTDGDFQISVTDAGPKILSLGTATSNGFKTFDIRVSSVSVLSTS